MSKWEMETVEDICEILDSQRIPITSSQRVYGIYPYYGANGLQDYVNNYIFDDELVLVAEDGGNFGSKDRPIAYRVSGKCWVNNHAHVLKPRNVVNVDYLCYSLMFYNVTDIVNGATRQKLNQSALRKIKIPLPSLAEQQKIAAELDKISGLIAKRKSQIEKLDLLVKAKFVEMFGDPVTNPMGWEIVQLHETAHVVSGITKGRKSKSVHFTDVPYMAVSNVKDGYIDWTTVKSIAATDDEIEQYKILPNDVLMTEGGDPDKLGRGSIIKEVPENCIHQNHIFRVRCNFDTLNPHFFSQYLKHPKSKQYFLWCAKQTTGIASINMKQLRALPVLRPPISLQIQLADFLQKTEYIKTTMQKSLVGLETLYKARMQEYFE